MNRVRYPDGGERQDQPRWRQDFPIDAPDDHYLSRREFTRFLVLTSLAFTAGQFVIGFQSLLAPADRHEATPIAKVDEVPVGGSVLFHYPGPHDPCLLVRLQDGSFVAFGQKCTHLACAVVPRPELGRFHCPCHEGWFDIKDGRPLAGPPRRPLPSVALEVRDGTVYATGVTERTT